MLTANLVRQFNPQGQDESLGLFSVATKLFMGILLVLSVPLMCIGGTRLLPVWLVLITLQLIAHTLLLNSFMPQEIYFYLRDILQIMRLKAAEDEESLSLSGEGGPSLTFTQAGYSATAALDNLTMPLVSVLAASVLIFFAMVITDSIIKNNQQREKN